MTQKIWNIRIEGEGDNRICIVAVQTPSGMQEVEVNADIENLLIELQREHDKYSQREYRHESHLEQIPIGKIPSLVFGKSPEEMMIERYENRLISGALHQIPVVQRRRFILKYDYRLTTEEIARREGCSTRAIERSLTNARRKLRKLLQM